MISIGVLLLVVVLFLSFSSPSEEVIKIGVITGLTGHESLSGKWTQQGLELAKEEINANGGINGLPIKLLYEDSEFKPRLGLLSAKKLVEANNVDALITASGAGTALSILPYANEKKVIQMETVCIVPACHTKDDYLFRASGPPEDQSKFIAKFVEENLKYERVAILWINNDYGINQRDAFKKHFKGSIVGDEAYEQASTDFRTHLTKLAAKNPDIIFFASHIVDTGHILKQKGELEIDIPTIGTFTAQNAATLTIAGDHANGHQYAYFNIDFSSDKAKAYQKEYVTRYGEDPEVLGTKAYDALYILAIGMKGCKKGDNDCIMQNMLEIKNYPGMSNVITIDDHGDLIEETFDMKVIQDGKFVKLK